MASAADFPAALGDDLRLGGLLAIGMSMVLFAVLAAMAATERSVHSSRFSFGGVLSKWRPRPSPHLPRPPGGAAQTNASHQGTESFAREPTEAIVPSRDAAAPELEIAVPTVALRSGIGPARRPTAPMRSPSEARRLENEVSRAKLTDLAVHLEAARRALYTRQAAVEQIYGLAGRDLMVEMDVELGGIRVPFVILGRTGVFAVLPTDLWRFEDLACTEAIVSDLRRFVGHLGIEPQVIFYNPFGAQAERSWYDGRGRGAWVIGCGQLSNWLAAQTGPGVGPDEIAALREAAKPRWEPPTTVIAPSPTLPRG